MKNNLLSCIMIGITLLCAPTANFGQTPDLGTASTFALFTAAGAFSNVGATVVTGNIGTNVGAFTGFPPGIVIGQIHVADVVSAQAAADVPIAYSYLSGLTCGLVLGTTLGNGQVLTPNIYCLGAASVLNGTLVLDGQGDPDAIFIFQIDGALSTSTFAIVSLINSAQLCNVYWQINGAFNLGDNSVFRGTVVAGGALNLAIGATLIGRGLTTAGAISTSANVVTLSFCAPSIVCAAEVEVSCVSQIPAPNTNTVAVTVSCVGPYTVTFVGDVISNQTCTNRYTITRTYMVTDFCGTAAFCTQTILVNDQTPPTLTCPTVTASIECPATPSFPTATATDLCGGTPAITFTDINTPGGICAQAYSVTRTWTASDNCGNSATCSRTIAVTDLTPPTITCPTVTATIQCPATPSFPAATATDLCGGTPTINFTDITTPGGICAQAYSVTRTWTATDNCGNAATCSRTIAVVDNTPPVINCPTVTPSIECPATPSFAAATATDLCDGNPTINFTDLTTPGGICAQAYSVTRTWTATDNCGNSATCSRTIAVVDNTPPVINCPTVTPSIECPATPSFAAATATDLCDGNPTINFTDLTTPGGICAQAYSVTRTWTATDNCGNAATCSRTIAVVDNTPPVITCPTVTATVACPATPNFSTATATDLCGGTPTINFTDLTTPGGICAQAYSVTRTWTASDNCGNSATCSRTIAVIDNTPPVITCPTVTATVECPATPNFSTATATDLCGGIPTINFTDLTTPGGICAQAYSVTRTWTASDNCGNSATCSRTIAVVDLTAPAITCPTVTATIQCPATPSFATATATDLCDGNPTINFTDLTTPSGFCTQAFSVTRTWTAADNCGNTATCSRIIFVTDNTAPTISCPAVVSPIECPFVPASFGTATAVDLCGATPTINFSDVFTTGGICLQNYSVTRTWVATDDCGNSATCSRTISVGDQTVPVITCPTVVSPIECPFLPTAFGAATATDLCDGSPIISFNDITTPGGICAQSYSITRTWTATDNCGNTATCNRTIFVTDNTAPVVICPTVIPTIACPATPVFPAASASDLCSGTAIISFTDITTPGGICAQAYSVTRTWRATDNCGNSATCSRTIAVTDLSGPVITCPTVTASIECPATPSFGIASASDLCSTVNPVITFTDLTTQSGICSQEYSVTRTWTATDNCGNLSTCSRSISVTDNTPPVIQNPPSNILADCSDLSPVLILTALDLCAGNVPVVLLSEVQTPGICPIVYTILRTWSATDACGNSSTMSQTVTVTENTIPEFTTQAADLTLECDQLTNLDNYQNWLDNHAGAAILDCSNITWTYMDSPLITNPSECGSTFQNIIRFTATDACGNSAFQDAIFTVADLTPPVFTILPTNLEVECVEGYNSDIAMSDWIEQFGYAAVSDKCGSVATEVVFINEIPACGNTFTRIYEFRATDECGNTSYVRASFSVVDHTGPVIVKCPEGNVLLTCEFDVPPPDYAGVITWDNCGTVTVTANTYTTGVGCKYWPKTISYWYMATDECNNMTVSCDQSFQIVDSIPPIYTGPDTINVVCVQDLPGSGAATDYLAQYFVDNCYDIICTGSIIAQNDSNSVTYSVQSKDLCGNWAACFPVTFIATGACKPICAATQTMWGNKFGVINGITTTEAIEKFMDIYGGVTAGKLNKSITATSSDCIHQILPGDGSTAQLNQGNYTFGEANNCLPGSSLLNSDGTLKNKLATNVIAMQFNVWYNLEYNSRSLGVQELVNLPPCLIHQTIMNRLETGHVTVQGLLNLSNDYLAGIGAFPPKFGNMLNSALENLNNYWENCQINNPCASKTRAGTYTEDKLYNLNLAPNPVTDLAIITFEIASDAELVVRFVSNTGIQSESLNQVVIGFNSLSFSTKNFPSGVYTIVLQHGKDLQTLRMVKVAN